MHTQQPSTAVLLVNLGTPDSPSRKDVRRYLKEFLWDPRVVEGPRLPWWLVLNLIILNTRPAKSAAAYQKVWTDRGSPLLAISRDQQQSLQAAFDEALPGQVKVALAMRYGKPAMAETMVELQAAGIKNVLVLQLYPQYSATTTASTFDAIADALRTQRDIPELRFINRYGKNSQYIEALAASVRAYQQQNGTPQKLLMSFHGLPEDYCKAGDPYADECRETAQLLAAALNLQADEWVLSFQSRLGPRQWLQPYTDHTLEKLAGEGISDVQVICPGFSADCLETLEEIAMENRDVFIEAGGKNYQYIPCLNDQPTHIDMLQALATQHLSGWINE